MDDIYHIRMMNAEDVLCNIEEFDSYLIVKNAIQVIWDPEVGSYARRWLLLSEGGSVSISKDKMLFYTLASKEAERIYFETLESISKEMINEMLEDEYDEFNSSTIH